MSPYSAIALVVMLAASPALACTGQSVRLAGDFQTGDLGWGQEDAGPRSRRSPEPRLRVGTRPCLSPISMLA